MSLAALGMMLLTSISSYADREAASEHLHSYPLPTSGINGAYVHMRVI